MSVPALPTGSALALIQSLEDAGALSPTHLDLSSRPDLSVETCTSLAAFFGQLNHASRWWIGDLLIFTEMRYGEYVAQVAEATNLSPQTVENVISVANRVPPSRRRDGVSFSIHAEVAALLPNEQRHWLKVAKDERLTRSDLRARLQPALPPAVASREGMEKALRWIAELAGKHVEQHTAFRHIQRRALAELGEEQP